MQKKHSNHHEARPGGGEEGELLDPQQVADEVRERDDKDARENAAYTIEALVRRAGRSQQSGAPKKQPRKVVRSGAWVGEAKAALSMAQQAKISCAIDGDWLSLSALERAVDLLRGALDAERRTSPTKQLSESE